MAGLQSCVAPTALIAPVQRLPEKRSGYPFARHATLRRGKLFTNTGSCQRNLHSRRARVIAGLDGTFGHDDYGPYPWEQVDSPSSQSDSWVREPTISFLTADGLVRLGGERLPARRPEAWQSRSGARWRRFKEEDYMDPNQKLCLGATFDISATNGIDIRRRLGVFGFCRSVEMLSDVVEDMVLYQGGEVVAVELIAREGLQERLLMNVRVPMLWGVPPAAETLRQAIKSGGGIVDKVWRRWDFFQ